MEQSFKMAIMYVKPYRVSWIIFTLCMMPSHIDKLVISLGTYYAPLIADLFSFFF